ncbi:lipopolysaccharide biosynthesis protein [Sphingomonas piscis]|uniref:Lipopolysaccharide biosynthesis protein n=1 Tax=Sphingomonas piscis TaxID=2714943 RepID=A0A6G7YQV7_9SPHN|nr:lipopolysaccharide biosynthesis protein [Sphingomonas piscis]QIK79117.1 lipopolysaccharide biosynthesis protein [Sphingomonas piscis]
MISETEQSEGGMGWFFNHLPTILWQRRNLVLVPFVVLSLAATIAAFALPTVYRSTASLLVQSQDLPDALVQSPEAGDIEQRIARIRERVLSRGDLIQLIEQNNLYPNLRRSKPLSKVVEKMRNSTTVGAQANDLGGQSAKSAPIAIDMSFDYSDPTQAQVVLQSFVNSFLTMDTEDVAAQAQLSVRFLEDQATKLRSQISTIENQLTSLKARNGSALASTGAPPMLDLGSYSTQIASLENDNRQLLAQASRAPPKLPELAAAEAALAAAEAMYSDSHPDVQAARTRLRLAQQLARESSAPNDSAVIRSQIAANNATIASLQQARAAAMARAQASATGSARAPAILEQAMQLENKVSGLRDQYKLVSDNLLKAQNGARLANEQRAERLSLVEPPSLPDSPYSPNRPLLVAAGAAAGLIFGLLLACAVEFIRRPLRSPSQIETLGLPLIGVVPLIGENKQPNRFGKVFQRKRVSVA